MREARLTTTEINVSIQELFSYQIFPMRRYCEALTHFFLITQANAYFIIYKRVIADNHNIILFICAKQVCVTPTGGVGNHTALSQKGVQLTAIYY